LKPKLKKSSGSTPGSSHGFSSAASTSRSKSLPWPKSRKHLYSSGATRVCPGSLSARRSRPPIVQCQSGGASSSFPSHGTRAGPGKMCPGVHSGGIACSTAVGKVGATAAATDGSTAAGCAGASPSGCDGCWALTNLFAVYRSSPGICFFRGPSRTMPKSSSSSSSSSRPPAPSKSCWFEDRFGIRVVRSDTV